MFLMVDNYDSFTYNLVQYMAQVGYKPEVRRNDKLTLADVERMAPEGIIISPGPKRPEDAGLSLDIIKKFAGRVPLLGICLGHQSIGAAYGARIVSAGSIMHGKTSKIEHDGRGLFQGLANPFEAGRYHSLAIEESSMPDCLEVSARSEDGEVMGVRHREFLVEGLQFHPESVLTPQGKRLLRNFFNMVNGEVRQ
jgi:anthranilate synthase/aminodeoxychorismate synthase-like glutamine amidotransferase